MKSHVIKKSYFIYDILSFFFTWNVKSVFNYSVRASKIMALNCLLQACFCCCHCEQGGGRTCQADKMQRFSRYPNHLGTFLLCNDVPQWWNKANLKKSQISSTCSFSGCSRELFAKFWNALNHRLWKYVFGNKSLAPVDVRMCAMFLK